MADDSESMFMSDQDGRVVVYMSRLGLILRTRAWQDDVTTDERASI